MISFLKNFLSGEKPADQHTAAKKRDVLVVDAYAMAEEEEAEEACAPKGGCGGCGCH